MSEVQNDRGAASSGSNTAKADRQQQNDSYRATISEWDTTISKLSPEERIAWRLAPVKRPSADERGLQKDFAFGWYAVAYSDELDKSQVKALRYFGKELALWRGDDGQPRMLDAYCAHYGANMAHGGRVHGNHLECPFHAWRYDEEGVVREIPYAKLIPPQARKKDCVPSWVVKEANGFIYAWYHPKHEPPKWELMEFSEVGDPEWTDGDRFEWHIYTHIQNLSDNGVDSAHFKYVHGVPSVPKSVVSYEGIKRKVRAEVEFVTPRGEVHGAIESLQNGAGQGCVRFTGLTDTFLVSGSTPVDRDDVHVRFRFIQKKSEVSKKGGLARGLVADICKQMDQDKLILDHHKAIHPPLVCDGDGPFGPSRKYYSQFYVDPSATELDVTP